MGYLNLKEGFNSITEAAAYEYKVDQAARRIYKEMQVTISPDRKNALSWAWVNCVMYLCRYKDGDENAVAIRNYANKKTELSSNLDKYNIEASKIIDDAIVLVS